MSKKERQEALNRLARAYAYAVMHKQAVRALLVEALSEQQRAVLEYVAGKGTSYPHDVGSYFQISHKKAAALLEELREVGLLERYQRNDFYRVKP